MLACGASLVRVEWRRSAERWWTRVGNERRMKAAISAVLVLALDVLGCGGEQGSGGDSRPDRPATSGGASAVAEGQAEGQAREPAAKVLVTSDDPSLPDGCHPRAIAGLVIDFIDAFNRGDQERLSRLFFISEGPSPRTSRKVGITRGRGTR
jgi:hypothetical protein